MLLSATGELVTQARAFQDLRVEDVMKPRADIVSITRSCTFAELVARFIEAEHSRMPVYKETLDEPVGVVHVKDVFKLLARKNRPAKPEDKVLTGRHSLVREVLYVPPSQTAAQLLTTMRAKRTTERRAVAVVVRVVTLEKPRLLVRDPGSAGIAAGFVLDPGEKEVDIDSVRELGDQRAPAFNGRRVVDRLAARWVTGTDLRG